MIRDKDHPWGLPPHLLTPAEQQKIEDGNRCFLTRVKVAQACIANHVRFILENPWSSKAWRLPPVQKLLQQPQPAATTPRLLESLSFKKSGEPYGEV